MHTDWNIINTIGCWFGGIATALAAFYTIKQFKLVNCRKLNLKINYELLFRNTVLGGEYVGAQLNLKIMNTGSKSVTIEEWGVNFQKTNFSFMQLPNLFNSNTRIPITVEPNHSVTLSVAVLNLYDEISKLIEKGVLKENNKLNFYIRDNFDERYIQKTKITYEQIKGYATMNSNDQ